jgi:hypothetical protein
MTTDETEMERMDEIEDETDYLGCLWCMTTAIRLILEELMEKDGKSLQWRRSINPQRYSKPTIN